MNVIGCERSGVVSGAIRRSGYKCISVDLLPCENLSDDEFHFTGDIMDFLSGLADKELDFLGLHPECTKLCVSGNHVYSAGKSRHGERVSQVEWVCDLWELAVKKSKRVYLENPVGVLSTSSGGRLPKPQYIQPYDFGEDASKKTALFLHGLKPLVKTVRFPGRIVFYGGREVERWGNQTDSGQNKLAPSENRWMERSRTYQGIADAMVAQWLGVL